MRISRAWTRSSSFVTYPYMKNVSVMGNLSDLEKKCTFATASLICVCVGLAVQMHAEEIEVGGHFVSFWCKNLASFSREGVRSINGLACRPQFLICDYYILVLVSVIGLLWKEKSGFFFRECSCHWLIEYMSFNRQGWVARSLSSTNPGLTVNKTCRLLW